MTAQDLVVDALSATLVGVPPSREARRWLDETTADLVQRHLPRATADAALPPGHWFIPRLDLVLSCGDLGALPALAEDWARAILDSLAQSLATDSGWVHFATDVELVAGCVVAAITGSTASDWVWVEAGLLDPSPAGTAPADRVVAAVGRRPHVAVASLARAAERSSVAALDRALGESGWYAVAVAAGANGDVLDSPPHESAASPVASTPVRGTSIGEATVASSRLAILFRRSRLRPSPSTARVWAWLVVAEVEPSRLMSPSARTVVDDTAAQLLRLLPGAPPASPTDRREARGPGRLAEGQAARSIAVGRPPDVPREDAAATTEPVAQEPGTLAISREPEREPSIPEIATRGADLGVALSNDADTASGLASAWAGLLYLLASARAAGLPDVVLEDVVLAARGVRWSVWQAATLLVPAAPDDPALLALAGLPSDRAAHLFEREPASAVERRRLARLASQWRRVTVTQLRRGDPEAGGPDAGLGVVLHWLVHRTGLIVTEPGWIDVVLPLSAVDTSIRVAGLDLDPGFVPWLGTVVRFRYE